MPNHINKNDPKHRVLVIPLAVLLITTLIESSSASFVYPSSLQCSSAKQCGLRKHHGGNNPPSCLMMAPRSSSKREDEIRRKISQLKKAGKISKGDSAPPSSNNTSSSGNTDDFKLQSIKKIVSDNGAYTDYESKISDKLGGNKKIKAARIRMGRDIQGVSIGNKQDKEENDDDDEYEMDEEEGNLVDLVAQKLQANEEVDLVDLMAQKLQANDTKAIMNDRKQSTPENTSSQITSGIGGKWNSNSTEEIETYKPKIGTWGVFERPDDISKAYGGGKRVGAGWDNESDLLKATEDTRDKLKRYREKMGIEVQSEKDHENEINEALSIAGLAMQRGIYSTAVSALSKVTAFCSTNSKLGGKVFLELAMAYEASGSTSEAINVYTTLSKSPIEEVKINAKKLLYGLEAMNFMRDEIKLKSFSRKKIKNTFVDATDFANIAENFDDRYQTAYVDLNKSGIYKKLTQSLVRTTREARMILLKARDSKEVDRLKVVQALRIIARNFDDALNTEINTNKEEEEEEPTAVMNGVPISKTKKESIMPSPSLKTTDMDKFDLATPNQMMENINGEWRLQLMADKTGDGVKYYNNTLSWQNVNTQNMTFKAYSTNGFLTTEQQGELNFDKEQRLLSKSVTKEGGGGAFLFKVLSGGVKVGAISAILSPQQIIIADDVLCVTRLVEKKKTSVNDNVKDYFSVWRKTERVSVSD